MGSERQVPGRHDHSVTGELLLGHLPAGPGPRGNDDVPIGPADFQAGEQRREDLELTKAVGVKPNAGPLARSTGDQAEGSREARRQILPADEHPDERRQVYR